MLNQFSRTELLYGDKAMERLSNARVAVFGIGGVGGHAMEALARSGVGSIDLIDNDTVCMTNINRQIIATLDTLNLYKVDAARDRIAAINPNCNVTVHKTFFMPETSDQFDFSQYDYVIDAIDTITGKIELTMKANKSGTPIISSMGAGNKLYPQMFEVDDIYNTSVCPLARVMRNELRKRGIKKLKVVYSKEKPITPIDANDDCKNERASQDKSQQVTVRKQIPGSNAFVPSVVGLIIAGEVINDIAFGKNQDHPLSGWSALPL